MRLIVQNQGMRKILPKAYRYYSVDKNLFITKLPGEISVDSE